MVGTAVVTRAAFHWQSDDWVPFVCYLVIAAIASGLKVQLPGIDGNMSVSFLFILIGISNYRFPKLW
jgi:hypothetical protein